MVLSWIVQWGYDEEIIEWSDDIGSSVIDDDKDLMISKKAWRWFISHGILYRAVTWL